MLVAAQPYATTLALHGRSCPAVDYTSMHAHALDLLVRRRFALHPCYPDLASSALISVLPVCLGSVCSHDCLAPPSLSSLMYSSPPSPPPLHRAPSRVHVSSAVRTLHSSLRRLLPAFPFASFHSVSNHPLPSSFHLLTWFRSSPYFSVLSAIQRLVLPSIRSGARFRMLLM